MHPPPPQRAQLAQLPSIKKGDRALQRQGPSCAEAQLTAAGTLSLSWLSWAESKHTSLEPLHVLGAGEILPEHSVQRLSPC